MRAAVRLKDCFNIDLTSWTMKQCTKNMFEEFVDFLITFDQNSRLSNSTEKIKGKSIIHWVECINICQVSTSCPRHSIIY
jgi:L-rhamnose isomerase